MNKPIAHECSSCGKRLQARPRVYRFEESGLSNVVLRGAYVALCSQCGNSDVLLPKVTRIHQAIAKALTRSPARLTGEQLRFLRKHLGLTGEQLGRYLHTDRTKVSKWERGEDRIGPSTDRLVRLLVVALDKTLRGGASAVAENLPKIGESLGDDWILSVDVETLGTDFSPAKRAA